MEPVTADQAPEGQGEEIVLALNSGSSSLKFGLYAVGPTSLACLMSEDSEAREGPEDALDRVCALLADRQTPSPTIVGHRVVHGGPTLTKHCLITPDVLAHLEASVAFAPLHNPPALALIHSAQKRFPALPQAACFDTAFHASMPDVASVLPLPQALLAEGVRRYGFHGLSCQSIVDQLGAGTPDRLIIAHLGNGASITAVKAGRSVDTSMGLTPSGGVIMGSRSGDLDPGVLLYLLREKHLDPEALETLIDQQSGLRGISGLSNDMRRLHAASATDPAAALAIEMFCMSVRKQIAAMIAVLEGVDLIVFTGGIGENDPIVRSKVCDGLGWAGVTDMTVDGDPAPSVAAGPSVTVRSLPSQEDEQIARRSRSVVAGSA